MLKTIVLARRQCLHQLQHISKCKFVLKAFPMISSRYMAYSQAAPASRTPSPIHSTTSKNSSPRTISSTDISVVHSLLSAYGKTKDLSQAVQRIHSTPSLTFLFSDKTIVRQLAEKFAITQYPKQGLDILNFAHAFGCQPKINAYECVCFHLASVAQWHLLLCTIATGKEHTGRTSIRLLNWRARGLIEVQDYLQLGGLLKEMEGSGIKPNRRTFHLIISGHIRNHDLPRAKESMRAMEDAGFPVDASTHAMIATYYRAFGVDDEVEEQALNHLFNMSRNVAVAVLNHLIRSRLDNQDLRNALCLLTLFDRGSVETAIAVSFGSAAVSYMAEISQPSSSLTYSSTPLEPLIPNASTFSIFINQCSARRDLAGAVHLLQCMRSQGITPTSSILASIIHACFAGGRGDLGVHLVASNCDQDLTPRSLFDPILPEASANNNLDVSFSNTGSLTTQVFNALLQGTLPTYGLDGARTVLHIMQLNNAEPNAKTLGLLLSHLDRVEHAHPRTLIRLMRTLSTPVLKPTLTHMQALFRCVYRREKYLLHGVGWKGLRRFDSPQRYIPKSRSSTMSDDFDTFAGMVLPDFRRYRHLTWPFLNSLRDRQIMTDSASIAMRIRHAAVVKMDMDTAEDIFRTMLARGMHPNAYHFSALLEGHAVVGNIKAALNVMESVKKLGITPNVVLYTILITAYSRQGNPERAINAFQEMVNCGVIPDIPSIDAVTSAFYAVGASAMAKRLLISLWPYVQPFPEDLRNLPLLALAHHFRLLHSNPSNTKATIPTKERLSLHLKVCDLVEEWQHHNEGKC